MRMILRAVYSHNYGENRLVGSKQDVEEELQVVHLVIQVTSYCVNDQSQLVGTKQDVEELQVDIDQSYCVIDKSDWVNGQ